MFQWVVGEKCDPAEFEWVQERREEHTGYSNFTYQVSTLIHRPTGFYVVFGSHWLTISPGPRRKVEEEQHEGYWGKIERIVGIWLRRVRAEHQAPDLWAMALQDREFLRLSSVLEATNTNFTSEEQQYISTRLDEIREFVIESADLDEEQQQLIAAQIEFTKQATKRLARLDWKGVLVNTLITVAVSASFAPERASQLFHMVAEFFMPLYQSVREMIP